LLDGDRRGDRPWHEPFAHRARPRTSSSRSAAHCSSCPVRRPLSLVHLRNLTLATEGRPPVVLPAAPGFYHKPQQVRGPGGLRGAACARPAGARHQSGEALGREGEAGVISDTHGLLRPEGVRGIQAGRPHFACRRRGRAPDSDRARSDRAGDAVYGNADGPELRARLPQVAEVGSMGSLSW